ncbi:MAG: pyridoxal-phosphate dependent enzyme [Pseudonocardiaceae bacterium]|nr:pyridoxal-phosphate dependent enzyme [Pseudonocardiaceae bacterium]
MTGLLGQPTVALATAPTPLQPAPNLSAELGVEIWFKRDDLIGFGLGGNKVRLLEYLLGDAVAQGCDCLITGAGAQSNWAMLAALAARHQGLATHLVFYGDPVPATGNLLLAELAGARITFTGDPDRASVDGAIATLAGQLQQAGHRPCALPRGGATPVGALGYVRASVELAEQLLVTGLRPRQLWLPTGACGTQAGLVAGAGWLRLPHQVIGVTASRPVDSCVEQITALVEGTRSLLGSTSDGTVEVTVLDGFIGPGYGVRSPEGEAAAEFVARREGVFLDPVFGAKAMAALVDTVRATDRSAGPVVFLVTGGAPTLFSVGGAL